MTSNCSLAVVMSTAFGRDLRRSGLSDSYFRGVQFWIGLWPVLAFFSGRSSENPWQSMRGTVRTLKNSIVTFLETQGKKVTLPLVVLDLFPPKKWSVFPAENSAKKRPAPWHCQGGATDNS